MFDLSGKFALVTGSSRGIGRGIALALAGQGANVAINYTSSTDKAQSVVTEIIDMGRDSFLVQADVSKRDQVVNMFNQIRQKWGRLDILVNNAGVIDYATFEDLTEEKWDRVLDVNLKGQFLFQIRPDLFPQGFLTHTEMELWSRYLQEKHGNK